MVNEDLPSPDDVFARFFRVPCRTCMKKLLAVEYGL